MERSQFRVVRGDTLNEIILCIGIFLNKWGTIITCSFLFFSICEVLCAGILWIKISDWNFWQNYIPFQAANLLAFVSYFNLITKRKKFLEICKLFQNFWNLESAGQRAFQHIKVISRTVKIFLFFNWALLTIPCVVVLPWRGNPIKISVYDYIFENYFGKVSYIFIIISHIQIYHGALAILTNFSAALYLFFHLKFQLLLLNKRIKDIGPEFYNTSPSDEQSQYLIHAKLVDCIQHHCILIEYGNNINKFVYAQLLLHFIVAVVSAITILLFIQTNKYEFSYFLLLIILPVIGNVILLSIGFLLCGQSIENESEKIHQFVCNLPWVNFNMKNRCTLKLLICNSMKLISISTLAGITLNLSLLLKIFKTAYSALTFLLNVGILHLKTSN